MYHPIEIIKNYWAILIRKLSHGVSCQDCEVNGHLIHIGVSSELEKYRADTYATKEPETIEWMDRFFKTDEVMWDIGANIGLYSLYAARAKGLKIFAFEPESTNFARLNNNINLNQLSDRMTAYNVPVGGEEKFDLLYLNPHSQRESKSADLTPGAAMHNVGGNIDHAGAEFASHLQQGVFMSTGDRLVEHWGIPFPNHIKIDVDGLEEEIISGMQSVLSDPRLRSLLVEVSMKRVEKDMIYKEMLRHGFEPVTEFSDHSSRQLKGTPYEDCYNMVFVRDHSVVSEHQD